MSDHEEDIENSLFIHYNFDFSICRLVDTVLLPSTIRVKAEISIMDENIVDLALRKINYWLDEYVNGAIAVPASDLALSLVLNDKSSPRLQNHLIITPDNPTDEHLCLLLQAKLQALGAGAFAVGMIEITSDNADGLTFTYLGNSEELLPTMEEWVPGPTWFSVPWWLRDDSSTFDTMAPAGTDLSVMPPWATDLSFLAREFVPREAIVLKGNFVPRIIEDTDKDE